MTTNVQVFHLTRRHRDPGNIREELGYYYSMAKAMASVDEIAKVNWSYEAYINGCKAHDDASGYDYEIEQIEIE